MWQREVKVQVTSQLDGEGGQASLGGMSAIINILPDECGWEESRRDNGGGSAVSFKDERKNRDPGMLLNLQKAWEEASPWKLLEGTQSCWHWGLGPLAFEALL